MLGVRVENGALTVAPHLPKVWDRVAVERVVGGKRKRIEIRRDGGDGKYQINVESMK